MLSNVGQDLERMAAEYAISKATAIFHLMSWLLTTYPLSPVAKIKFFHLGCSQISRFASAVSVHQHIVRLKSSLSLKRGKSLAIAFRMVTSEASGYVSVGCFACDRGTDIILGEAAPYG